MTILRKSKLSEFSDLLDTLATTTLDALLGALSDSPPPQARILALASFFDRCLVFGIAEVSIQRMMESIERVLGEVQAADRLGLSIEEALLWLLERAWTELEGDEIPLV